MVQYMTKNDTALTRLSGDKIREELKKVRAAHADGLQSIIDNYELLLADRDRAVEDLQKFMMQLVRDRDRRIVQLEGDLLAVEDDVLNFELPPISRTLVGVSVQRRPRASLNLPAGRRHRRSQQLG